MEDVNCLLFFMGIENGFYYLPIYKDIDYDSVFTSNKVPETLEKAKLTTMHNTWACNYPVRQCHGQFCHYYISDNSKYLTYPGKAKIFEKDFSLIPKKNKIF